MSKKRKNNKKTQNNDRQTTLDRETQIVEELRDTINSITEESIRKRRALREDIKKYGSVINDGGISLRNGNELSFEEAFGSFEPYSPK